MTTITLTQEQIAAVVGPATAAWNSDIRRVKTQADKAYMSLQRRTDRRVESANARAAEWKQHYGEARKQLLEARAEIVELKRRLREER